MTSASAIAENHMNCETWSQRRARTRANLDLISAEFPSMFGKRAVPLAIGIDNQIAARMAGRLTPDEVAAALALWTSRRRYLKVLARAGAVRRNLDGSQTGLVSEEHRAIAAERLAKMREPPTAAVAAQKTPPAADGTPQTPQMVRPRLTLPVHQEISRRPVVVVIKRPRLVKA